MMTRAVVSILTVFLCPGAFASPVSLVDASDFMHTYNVRLLQLGRRMGFGQKLLRFDGIKLFAAWNLDGNQPIEFRVVRFPSRRVVYRGAVPMQSSEEIHLLPRDSGQRERQLRSVDGAGPKNL